MIAIPQQRNLEFTSCIGHPLTEGFIARPTFDKYACSRNRSALAVHDHAGCQLGRRWRIGPVRLGLPFIGFLLLLCCFPNLGVENLCYPLVRVSGRLLRFIGSNEDRAKQNQDSVGQMLHVLAPFTTDCSGAAHSNTLVETRNRKALCPTTLGNPRFHRRSCRTGSDSLAQIRVAPR